MGNFIVGAVLLAVVFGIFFKLRKDKKAGKSSCGCNCASCGACHSCKVQQ